ncbi:SCO2521 family protein [Nocardia sp. BMG51109]|uniref:SCO2521 family protein n=1 Tax=Nocardia sp. BMG51109 TaxID=1056816 RepID=UPI000463A5F3|nr:SCO2521 family protein [Nocardia sp. BMG51109]
MATPLVVLGEVRTCLLPSAVPLTRPEAVELLTTVPGRAVRWRERPGSLALSPTTAVGVDCALSLGADPVHIVGTVATRTVLAGGRVLQSSAHTRVVRATERRRQTWSHYVSQKGVTEIIDRIPERAKPAVALADSYLAGPTGRTTLDLASISERLLARVRADARLDQNPPLRAGSTRLRWTAGVGGSAGPSAKMRLDDATVRSIRVTVREEKDLAAAQRFCEDVAAHDWLLTALADAFDEADRFASHSRERTGILAPALEHLPGLWMPGAHTPAVLRTLWKDLQAEPGFTRQWSTLVTRLRDSIAVATLNTLRHKDFDPNW